MPKFNLLQNLMTDAELANEFHRCVRTIQRWRRLGIGPAVTMVGDTPMTTIEDARAYLIKRRKVPPTPRRPRRQAG